jgi:hypothetical protein
MKEIFILGLLFLNLANMLGETIKIKLERTYKLKNYNSDFSSENEKDILIIWKDNNIWKRSLSIEDRVGKK